MQKQKVKIKKQKKCVECGKLSSEGIGVLSLYKADFVCQKCLNIEVN